MVSRFHQFPRESGPDRTASDDENVDVVLAHTVAFLSSGVIAGNGWRDGAMAREIEGVLSIEEPTGNSVNSRAPRSLEGVTTAMR
jgi:hypothetical protein